MLPRVAATLFSSSKQPGGVSMAKKKTNKPASTRRSTNARPLTPTRFRRLAEPFLRRINVAGRSPDILADKLRAFHEFGTLLRKHVPERAGYGAKQFAVLGEAIGHTSSWIYKVWRFPGEYDAKDLGELCKTPICWGHVVLLLPLDKPQRRKYQRLAASRKWTVEDLRRALQADFEPLRRGGRQVKIPDNPADALRQLVGEGQVWVQRSKAVQKKLQSKTAKKSVKDQATAAAEALAEISEASMALAKDLRQAGT